MAKKTVKKKAAPKKMGRPDGWSQEKADKICEMISTSHKSLRTICLELKISVTMVLKWLRTRPEFTTQYTRAKEEQADYLAEEMIEISDDGTNDYMTITKGDATYNVENKEVTNRSRLRVETRKWIASKLKPKKYGEKLDVTSDGKELKKEPTIIKWGDIEIKV